MRIVHAAECLAADGGPEYDRLRACFATLGYRGHPVTKSRRFSTTFGVLRRARAAHHVHRPGLDRDADVRELLDPNATDIVDIVDVVELREWRYAGRGYLDADAAANAVRAACLARRRRTRDLASRIEPDHVPVGPPIAAIPGRSAAGQGSRSDRAAARP